ncbi:asparagine--tRNA ligase [Candidatus Pacearchaeota archaeon CG10_big_fil_rev_8_21_14_0_10_35_219]|nr:asparagine--tRNA ligase [Candidatus Pacearchaeota archaeon]OIO42755.1 MAG: asparagine--tRNA ligase [Candidatus Pacearchaeota archaeon CG1_02_35_32]PIO08223.1 MAG: asparagine--tRNA ligase [Candidatus Pacearchaeota archaeon CG10_big_fil_rev_8_21_14_0_10_35_219]PIY81733.1 MAG: asparagine--tRNA ligase [Candidatus Pacearchaeota archaeon CG_4_10_14_0_8_um_filter_35_169]PIZ80363.1 MAG: asparagine--tRNA ligase [Candidatus Pacearchaeota archaeon CG_4_10_14_0_2_um_filter_35_33]PJA69949.1 MAG: asparag
MKYTSIKEAMSKGKGKVAVRGWIHRERGSNKIKFIVLRDSSQVIQIVFPRDKFEKQWDEIDKLQVEASIIVEGSIKKDKRAPTGYEISASKVEVVGKSDKFPINKDLNEELLGDRRHLWIRSRKMAAIMKIRSTVMQSFRDYFREKGFWEFQGPILILGGAEEGPTLFEVKYFDRKMYLAQTWQLYAEAAMYGLEKIYGIGPTFRAEKSKTSRHLTEFWMAEMEVAWCDLSELIDYAEEMTKYIIKKVLEKHKEELEILERDVKKLIPSTKKKFPRITYDEALKILDKGGMKIKWGKDLRTVEEEKLMEGYDTPVFVTHYPREVMAFYKPKDPKNPRTALCFDMLGPEGNGELIGGSQRDIDIKEMEKALKAKGENLKDYKYYLEISKYGAIPHAGYGLGPERLIKWICGLDNVKDTIGFPRTMTRYYP